jgi:hypothetical protein
MMTEPIKEMEKASSVRMEPADNGVVISYTIKTPKGPYDCTWTDKREVFAFSPNDKSGMMKAMMRFCELSCMGEDTEDDD